MELGRWQTKRSQRHERAGWSWGIDEPSSGRIRGPRVATVLMPQLPRSWWIQRLWSHRWSWRTDESRQSRRMRRSQGNGGGRARALGEEEVPRNWMELESLTSQTGPAEEEELGGWVGLRVGANSWLVVNTTNNILTHCERVSTLNEYSTQGVP